MSNKPAVPVDFGNRDTDGAVRLVTRGTLDHLQSNGVVLTEGLQILMTDGEIVAEGTCTQRDGMWVARVTRWLT
jgi:hypothetical protein